MASHPSKRSKRTTGQETLPLEADPHRISPHPLIHSGIDPADYQAAGDLSNISNWRARIHLGNSATDHQKPGMWDEVGYVMVSKTGPIRVIPIARADEHHRGFELLHKQGRSWGIRASNWVPVYSRGTGMYLYSKSDIPLAIEILRRWHEVGGPEVYVRCTGYNDLDRKKWRLGSRDFISGKGEPVLGSDGLLPDGQAVVDALSELWRAVEAVQANGEVEPRALRGLPFKRIERAAVAFGDILDRDRELAFEAFYDSKRRGLVVDDKVLPDLDETLIRWRGLLETALTEREVKEVERLIFTHGAPKCRIHRQIRKELADGFGVSRTADIFGDLELANEAFGRISPGLTPEESLVEDPSAAKPT